jgi:hypothetical protein
MVGDNNNNKKSPIGENSTNLVTLVGKQNELNKKISVSSVPSSAALMRFGSA